MLSQCVAPRVGAWIETPYAPGIIAPSQKSHPVWVRGLKRLLGNPIPWHQRRTPCGCVD